MLRFLWRASVGARVRRLALCTLLLAAVIVTGCDVTDPSHAATIVRVGNTPLTGTVGRPLAVPVEIQIKSLFRNSMYGMPLHDVPFTVSVTSGGGTLVGTPALTSRGSTSIGVWTLGTVAGTNTLTVTSSEFPPLTIEATASPGPPTRATAVGSTTGCARAGLGSPISPSIRLNDAFGNVVPGVTVSTVLGAGSGTVATPNPVSDAAGIASVGTWTLGATPGPQTVTMTAVGLPPVVFSMATTGSFSVDLRFVGTPPSAATQAALVDAACRVQQAVTTGLTPVPLVNFSAAAACDDSAFPVMNETVHDVVIFAEVTPIDGVGGILGQSGPCAVRPSTGLPYVGIVQFDLADVNAMLANGSFGAVVLHEFHHILGFGTIWFASPPTPTMLSGISSTNPIFTGANARAQYLAAGGTSAAGVPVEAGGGAGTALAHWRETVFRDELMTGILTGSTQPYSRMTIGSLADIGYAVSYATADAYTVPLPGQLRANVSASEMMELKEILIHPRTGLDPFGRPWTKPAKDTVTITVRKTPRGQ